MLASCGGGPTAPVQSTVISGVASLGAPMTEAIINLKSLANGAEYFPGSTDLSGGFSFAVDTALYPPPYLIRVTSELGGQTASQFSFV